MSTLQLVGKIQELWDKFLFNFLHRLWGMMIHVQLMLFSYVPGHPGEVIAPSTSASTRPPQPAESIVSRVNLAESEKGRRQPR